MLQAKYERKPITYTIFYLAATRELDHAYDADHCCDVCAKGADLKMYGVDLACVSIFHFFFLFTSPGITKASKSLTICALSWLSSLIFQHSWGGSKTLATISTPTMLKY